MRPILTLFAIASWLTCSADGNAGQPPTSELLPPGHIEGPALLICPPKYPESVYISAEELLAKADALNPMTVEGFIVRNRPVADCGQIPDAATRAFENFEFPLKMRHYESQIRLLQAEIRMLDHRVEEYRYFNKANALYITAQETELALLAARERLRNLRYERMLLLKHRQTEKIIATQGVIVHQEPVE